MMREKTEAAKDKTQGAGRSTQPMKQLNQLKTRHLKAHKQLNRKLKTPRTKREATCRRLEKQSRTRHKKQQSIPKKLQKLVRIRPVGLWATW